MPALITGQERKRFKNSVITPAFTHFYHYFSGVKCCSRGLWVSFIFQDDDADYPPVKWGWPLLWAKDWFSRQWNEQDSVFHIWEVEANDTLQTCVISLILGLGLFFHDSPHDWTAKGSAIAPRGVRQVRELMDGLLPAEPGRSTGSAGVITVKQKPTL